MRKFYLSTLICLILSSVVSAQYVWVGAANNDWNDPANWTGGPSFPNAPGDNVVFNNDAQVNLNVADLIVNSIHITGSAIVRITSDNDAISAEVNTLTVNSTNGGAPALSIDAGSTLEISVTRTTGLTGEGFFYLAFGDGAKAEINGKLYFTGEDDDDFSSMSLPENGAPGTEVNVNSGGSIEFTGRSFTPFDYQTAYLHFNAGSTLKLSGEPAVVPPGAYDPASTVLVTGLVTNGITFNQDGAIGNLTYDCAGQMDTIPLEIGNAVTITGNLQFNNTNNKPVVLAGLGTGIEGAETINVNIPGNLIIQGQSSVLVARTAAGATNKAFHLNIGGNLAAGGTAFNLQTNNDPLIQPTTVFIKGNLQHTSGTFGASSTLVSESVDKLIIEMNGTTPQTISSYNGSINNAADQITLRINNSNAGGVTLLSPLTVGRLSFGSPDKGKLFTTSANVLTINNISGDAIVASGASDAGFVSGPVRRRTASVNPVSFPTGGGASLHETIVIPEGSGVTTYEATFFNTTHSDPSVVTPLIGIANYYYEVKRISGTENAAISLPFTAPVSGGTLSNVLLPAKYDVADWVNARGLTGTGVQEGNATSGFVTTELQSAFGLYTIAYGAQSALPTYLISFTAKKESAGALISWKTTDNSAPEYFEVMRAADGVHFSPLGTVAGEERKYDYQFTDNHLAAGNNYYRLRMVDKDGKITLSNIIVVMNGAKGVLITSLMPTIVTDRARLSVTASMNGNLQLVITDIQGRILERQVTAINTGNQEIWLNATRLAGGVYQVTGYINGDKTRTFRFIKK